MLRIPLLLLLGALATLGCFFVMQWLISAYSGQQQLASQPLPRISIHPLQPAARPRPPRPKPEKPATPLRPPASREKARSLPLPELSVQSRLPWLRPFAVQYQHPTPDIDTAPPFAEVRAAYMEQPIYPMRALVKELTGWVLVEFTLLADGRILNPVVVDSEPGDIFDRAALRALLHSRFQPRRLQGVPMRAEAMRLKYSFDLDAQLVMSFAGKRADSGNADKDRTAAGKASLN